MENLKRFRRKILPNERLCPFTKVQLETVVGVGPSTSAGCSPPIPYGQSVGRADGGTKRGLDGESGLYGENDPNGESECNGKRRRVDDLLGSKVPERRQTNDARSASLQSDNGDIRTGGQTSTTLSLGTSGASGQTSMTLSLRTSGAKRSAVTVSRARLSAIVIGCRRADALYLIGSASQCRYYGRSTPRLWDKQSSPKDQSSSTTNQLERPTR